MEIAIASGLFLIIVSTGIASFNYRNFIDQMAMFKILVGALIGLPIGILASTILQHKIIIGLFSLVLGRWKNK